VTLRELDGDGPWDLLTSGPRELASYANLGKSQPPENPPRWRAFHERPAEPFYPDSTDSTDSTDSMLMKLLALARADLFPL
jgi:hypothetical protein